MKKTSAFTKLFLGFYLSKELEYFLKNDPSWKKSSSSNNFPLKTVQFTNKKYFGIYCDSEPITLKEFYKMRGILIELIEKHIPQNMIPKGPIIIFPKYFIQ